MSNTHDPASSVAVFHPPRLPYHDAINERFGIDKSAWKALTDAVFPLAKSTDAICLALSYCKARGLDPFKRVVHIVPMWNSALGREVETVWPGIAEHRTTAFRTGQYAGADPTTFGPMAQATFTDKTKNGEVLSKTVRFPEWAQVTVYRMIGGQRVAFPGPRCTWVEYFAGTKGTSVPNARWCKSPSLMIEKCAESGALRKAFPEELGDEPTADEMEGKVTAGGVDSVKDITPAVERPTRADFAAAGPIVDHVEDGIDITPTAEDEAAADFMAQKFAGTGEMPEADELVAMPTPEQQAAIAGAEACATLAEFVEWRAANADQIIGFPTVEQRFREINTRLMETTASAARRR